MKLPPQTPAVNRGGDDGLSCLPLPRAIGPQGPTSDDLQAQHTGRYWVHNEQGTATSLHCAQDKYWAYCSGTKTYECCGKDQTCKKVKGAPGGWGCA
jgi:hypothetical protein